MAMHPFHEQSTCFRIHAHFKTSLDYCSSSLAQHYSNIRCNTESRLQVVEQHSQPGTGKIHKFQIAVEESGPSALEYMTDSAVGVTLFVVSVEA